MALFKFIANVFKKIAKLFSRKKGKGAASTRLPGERRIGIYGPSNVGKSVFFTMLYKACRQDREFNLSPDDPGTGKQLVNNLDTLRSGEWLPGTVEESELNFKASLRGGSQFPFSTRDYKGETVDLEQEGSAKEKLIQYFQDCDSILFMLSPEMIADPRKCEREIMSFTAMINQVTEAGGKGLRIPIGLMITKSDRIEGFENESQVTLIHRKAEYLKAKDFKDFVEGVCGQYHVARNIVFQEQVRDILQRLSLFFDFLMTLSMEFQVFFTSSVGHVRQVEEGGKTAFRPPEDPDGIGVKVPFLWVIETIRRKEKIAAVNGLRRFVFRLALVILIFYSVFYGLHLLPGRDTLVDMSRADLQPREIEERLQEHQDKWVVRNFGFFALPGANAARIPDRAAELTASYRAHRFLTEELPEITGASAIGELVTNFKTPQWKRDHDWYDALLGSQATSVDEAVWNHVALHNLDVAARIKDLQASSEELSDVTPEELQGQCQQIAGEFVEPGQGRDEFDRLRTRAEEVCERMMLSGQERQLLEQWDEIYATLEEVTSPYVPLAADVSALREEVSAFRDAVKSNASPQLKERAEIAATLDVQLRNMLLVLTPGNEQDIPALLQQIRVQSGDDLQALADWARRRSRREVDQKMEQAKTDLESEVKGKLADSPTLSWMLDPDLVSRLSQLKLSGARGDALGRYLSAVRSLKDGGADVTMRVISAPQNFAVVAKDPATGEYGLSQAPQGVSMKIRWLAGRPVQLGLRKVGAENAPPCDATPDFIFKVDNRSEVLQCPGTGGTPMQVVFEDLDAILRDRVGKPLSEAFSQ